MMAPTSMRRHQQSAEQRERAQAAARTLRRLAGQLEAGDISRIGALRPALEALRHGRAG